LAGRATDRLRGRDAGEHRAEQPGRPPRHARAADCVHGEGGAAFAVASAVVLPLFLLLCALLFWVAFKLQGSDLDFTRSWAVMLHGFMPWVVSYLLSLPVILGGESFGYLDLRDGTHLPSNLASWAPEEISPPLLSLLSSLDFFTLWCLVLLAIGYRENAKVSTGKAAATVFVLWLVKVGGSVGWAALFSR